MGTRADFWLGRGEHAEWLGSVGYDGYFAGIPAAILYAEDADAFVLAVARMIESRDDGTSPSDGWPWPWRNSRGTGCVYAWDDGAVRVLESGGWSDASNQGDDGEPVLTSTDVSFPDMGDRRAVALGARSGLLVMRSR